MDILTLSYPRGIYKYYTSRNPVPKWKKDEKEFRVGVTYHEHRGCQAYIPKPVIQMLGRPNTIKFMVKDNKRVEVKSGD